MSQAIRPSAAKFTGAKMAAILCAFFGVVIAVNVLMADLAISTFGGEVVANSYVASQHFNSWLGEARTERALGWHAKIGRDGADVVLVRAVDHAGRPLTGARVSAIAEHPLGLRANEAVLLREAAPGSYRAPLVAGRWRVRLAVVVAGHVWRTVGDVQ